MTSLAVKGVPSDHLISFFSFHVTDLPSRATPPFSIVGISAAKKGTNSPFSLKLAKGSRVMRLASESLNPVERWGFKIVGACQYKSYKVSVLLLSVAGGLLAVC